MSRQSYRRIVLLLILMSSIGFPMRTSANSEGAYITHLQHAVPQPMALTVKGQ